MCIPATVVVESTGAVAAEVRVSIGCGAPAVVTLIAKLTAEPAVTLGAAAATIAAAAALRHFSIRLTISDMASLRV